MGNGGKQNEAMRAEMAELRDENEALATERDGLQAKLDGAAQEHEELGNIAKDIEKERDYYFNKVVGIENLLKAEPNQEADLLKQIYEILYETEEDQGNQSQQQGHMNDC